MLKFNLDKQVNLTYYDQIKGQLLSAIYCGKIQEGDRLPSIQELTDSLAINYYTSANTDDGSCESEFDCFKLNYMEDGKLLFLNRISTIPML